MKRVSSLQPLALPRVRNELRSGLQSALSTGLLTAVLVLPVDRAMAAEPHPATAVAPPVTPIDPALVFRQPVVLLGEVHDNAAQHALRLSAFDAWLAQGARPALLMEQFDRSRQAAIDAVRAIAGQPDADAVIDAGAPDRKGWNWSFYRPFVALALRHGLPIVAVNVSRDEARAVIRDGLAANGFEPAVPADVLTAQAQAVVDSHCGMIGPPMAGRMALAQIARDQFMAQQVSANASRGALLLAGNGHVRTDIGVPRWLPPAVRIRTEAIGMLEVGTAIERAAYDIAVTTPAQARPDPCESMRAPPLR